MTARRDDVASPIGHVEQVMGTVASFTVLPGRLSDRSARRLIAEACAVLHDADATFTTWHDASPLSRIRRGELALAQAPPEVAEVLDLCAVARTASGGWFDPWSMPGGVDPTGLVKGWAVERAAAVLGRGGVGAAMVNAGGDIMTIGRPSAQGPWRVGIRHPWRAEALACIVEADGAVATSGAYERGSHLVDPFTGLATDRVASATVTGPSLAMADALATALAVGGAQLLDALAALPGYEAYIIGHDGQEQATPGMAFADAAVGGALAPTAAPGQGGPGRTT